MDSLLKYDVVDLFKVLGVNGSILSLITFTSLIPLARLTLIVLGIGYTLFKLYRGYVHMKWDRQDRRRRIENIEDG